MTDLDPAGVMGEHTQSTGVFPEGFTPGCVACEWSDWPCLPYRLAEALAALKALTTGDPTSVYHEVEEMRKALAASEARELAVRALVIAPGLHVVSTAEVLNALGA